MAQKIRVPSSIISLDSTFSVILNFPDHHHHWSNKSWFINHEKWLPVDREKKKRQKQKSEREKMREEREKVTASPFVRLRPLVVVTTTAQWKSRSRSAYHQDPTGKRRRKQPHHPSKARRHCHSERCFGQYRALFLAILVSMDSPHPQLHFGTNHTADLSPKKEIQNSTTGAF